MPFECPQPLEPVCKVQCLQPYLLRGFPLGIILEYRGTLEGKIVLKANEGAYYDPLGRHRDLSCFEALKKDVRLRDS